MDINKLRGRIVEKGLNISIVAENIGVSRSGLYRKLNNPKHLTIYDAFKIKEFLDLTDEEAIEIFLS